MALRHRIRLGTDMTTELLDTDDLGQTEAALSFAYDSRVRLHVIGQHTPVRTRLSRLTVGTLAVDHAEFMTDVMYEIDPPRGFSSAASGPEGSPVGWRTRRQAGGSEQAMSQLWALARDWVLSDRSDKLTTMASSSTARCSTKSPVTQRGAKANRCG
jgi:hypothetical protein